MWTGGSGGKVCGGKVWRGRDTWGMGKRALGFRGARRGRTATPRQLSTRAPQEQQPQRRGDRKLRPYQAVDFVIQLIQLLPHAVGRLFLFGLGSKAAPAAVDSQQEGVG